MRSASWPRRGSGTTSWWTARRRPTRCGCSRCPRRSACTWSAPGRGIAGCPPAPTTPASAAVVELVERISAGTEQLGSLLTDGERVSAHLVLTAERVVAAEAVRTLGSLALMGVRVDELIVNQILVQDDSYEYRNLPEHPAFDWYSERISEQQAVLDELDTTIGDVQLVLVPHLAGEPIGAQGAR